MWYKRLLNWLRPATAHQEPDPMKYLIVGLGNMGPDYDGTRHNIGFDVVDHLAGQQDVVFKNDTLGDLARFKHKGRTFILLKPSTFMNRSGKAVRYWLQKEKITQDRLLVVVDDLNIDLGSVRLRGKGSPGGHNGLKDIDQMLGGNKYARLRVGIGSDFGRGQQVDFVLGEWEPEEQEALQEVIEHSGKAVLAFGTIGLQHTMSAFNRK
jgi:peptidyl-tRNA hydrolase, PTH1 family